MPDMPSNIFREYDIRGRVPSELNPDNVYVIACEYAKHVAAELGAANPKICLGYDGRLSSPELAQAAHAGLVAGGADVLPIGLGPTPLTYYSVFAHDADGCMMVTGSHNPKDHNGLKLMIGKRPFFGAHIQALGRDCQQASPAAMVPKAVDIKNPDIIARYIKVLKQAGGALHDDINVVWDAGNGAAGDVLQQLVAALPGHHEVLFGEIDGNFPNHHPDPSVDENMHDLKQRVLVSGADIGFAFDGDGDRLGVVDSQGRIWAGDQLLAICASDVLKQHPGTEVIVDVKTSQGVCDHITALGGVPVIWKTGHSNVKTKMIDGGAKLGGEMSGHLFFADEYVGVDDALYAAMRVLRLLAASGESSAQLYDALPSWCSTSEMRMDSDDDIKFSVIAEIAKTLAAEGADVNTIDGVRVSRADGWWLLRASNTQPVLVARAEAKTEQSLTLLTAEMERYLAMHTAQVDAE